MFMPSVQGGHDLSPSVPLKTILTDLSLTSGLILCLDAADENSYSGSGQTWSDVSGTSNDYYLGAGSGSSTDDPTFNAGGYWDLDGGDYFTPVSASKLSTIDDMHQDNADFTWWARVYTVAGGGSAQYLLNNNINGSNQNDVGVIWRNLGTTTQTNQVQVYDVPVNNLEMANQTTDTISNDAWHNIALSVDEASGGTASFAYIDGGIMDSGFDGTYSSPNTGVATDTLNIGATTAPTPGNFLQNGSKLAAFAMWTSSLTTSNLADIDAEMQRSEG